jgi:peroxiredoxin
MSGQLHEGQQFPLLRARTIQDDSIEIPDVSVPLVHLQFRRFAGCPICNLHLRDFVARDPELRRAGVLGVVVFHSAYGELLPYQGSFPFPVIGDPHKELYARYGVGTSPAAILHPGAWTAKGGL